MQIRFIPCLIFHNYKSEKCGEWVGMVGGGVNIAPGNITEIFEQQRASKPWLRIECRLKHSVNV